MDYCNWSMGYRSAYDNNCRNEIGYNKNRYRDDNPNVSYCDNRAVITGVACDTGIGYQVDRDYIKLLLD